MKLRIEKAIYGGAGLGRVTDAHSNTEDKLAGKAIFVPFTLPGEMVEAKITSDKRGYATANLQAVLEPAAARVAPGCEYFGRCGGCHYQHAAYSEQRAMKQAILAETLQRARINDVPPIQLLSAGPWEYRNRIRLVVSNQAEFPLGYREQRSHARVAVTHCPIAAPLLQRAMAVLTAAGPSIAGLCTEVELFCNGSQTSLMMTLLASHAQPRSAAQLTRLCETLKATLPELHGAILSTATKQEETGRTLAKWGEASLAYTAAGFDYRVGAAGFFQVNRFLVDALTQHVTQARKGRVAWDLYAGVGLFARALTADFEVVIAVESAPSHADLAHNLASSSGRAIRATTLDFLKQQPRTKTPAPDLIVVDPPRAGLGAEVCELLGKAGTREIVYVSCDPATMSRDLAALLQSGYSLQSLTLVDLFPQTFHMETVAVLARR